MNSPRDDSGHPFRYLVCRSEGDPISTIPIGHVLGKLRETLKEAGGYKQDLEMLVEQRTVAGEARDEAQAANRAKSSFLATSPPVADTAQRDTGLLEPAARPRHFKTAA